MTALVIAPHPVYSPRGAPLCVYYRTLAIARQGVRVDLLTYGEGQDVEIPGVRMIRIPHIPGTRGVQVGASWSKFLLDGLLALWALGLMLRRRYDFVHAHEESVFIAAVLKPLFSAKLVYDMHSCLPHILEISGAARPRFLIQAFEKLEDFALRKADAVITACPALYDYAARRVRDPKRVFLIENSLFEDVRLSESTPDPPESLKPADFHPARLLVLYAGTFQPYQGLEMLIAAFAQVRASRPDAFLLLVGGGSASKVERLRKVAADAGLGEDCLVTGRVPKALVRNYMEIAAVLISPRCEGINTPLKIFEQLASGVPLVATRVSSHTQILDEDVCFLVDPDAHSLAEGILAALQDKVRGQQVVERAKALYWSRYSPDAYQRKIQAFVESL